MKRPKINFDRAKELILVRLHKAVATNETSFADFQFLSNQIGTNIDLVRLTVEKLENDGLCTLVNEKQWGENPLTGNPESNDVSWVEITALGVDIVEGWSDDDYDRISKGIDLLEPDDGQQEKRSDIEPEDRWQPLPLERSGSKYENAVASTEAALKEIEGNNGYAESAPEERDRIVWSISEGLKHIKEGFPSRDQVISMLLKPLRYIAEKFSAASMGEAAKAAVKALLSWLALS